MKRSLESEAYYPVIYTCIIETPLGAMRAAAEDHALVGLWFVGQKYYPTQTARWSCETAHPIFETLRGYLASYFSGKADGLKIRLDPPGSPFQKAVWDVLLRIPVGQVKTYGQIAREIAGTRGPSSMSAQAVGGAVGHNRISILIPCHRVIGSDGHLRGYAGGLDRKAALLRLEKANLESL